MAAAGKPVLDGGVPLLVFNLTGEAEGDLLANFQQPVTVTVDYTDEEWRSAGIAREGDLMLYRWEEGVWRPALPCSGCIHSQTTDRFTIIIEAPGLYTLRGPRVQFLPGVFR